MKNFYQLEIGPSKSVTAADLRALILLSQLGVNFQISKATPTVYWEIPENMTLEDSTGNSESYIIEELDGKSFEQAFDCQVISQLILSAETDFKMSNIESENLIALAVNTANHRTIENFDKAQIYKGDIVCCYVESFRSEEIKKWYDDYILIPKAGTTPNAQGQIRGHDLFIGTSNTSENDYSKPFNEATLYVAASSSILNQ